MKRLHIIYGFITITALLIFSSCSSPTEIDTPREIGINKKETKTTPPVQANAEFYIYDFGYINNFSIQWDTCAIDTSLSTPVFIFKNARFNVDPALLGNEPLVEFKLNIDSLKIEDTDIQVWYENDYTFKGEFKLDMMGDPAPDYSVKLDGTNHMDISRSGSLGSGEYIFEIDFIFYPGGSQLSRKGFLTINF